MERRREAASLGHRFAAVTTTTCRQLGASAHLGTCQLVVSVEGFLSRADVRDLVERRREAAGFAAVRLPAALGAAHLGSALLSDARVPRGVTRHDPRDRR